ncbi:hypothetical protein EIP91_003244 [Steccherinum ochraceum]|uniref:Chromatin target of PRMT1 protein C-terminal domain-containing protein n=1 Tax=Steccherinum ochraceum TaxID=92696 RepID=A0A4R0RT26_9APHY|nr:hypothetical protein EIP91_003244 [Steccherinum ochraceum]
MDIAPEAEDAFILSPEPEVFDNSVLPEDTPPSRISEEAGPASLATRIGTTKVYVMPESSGGANRAGKRKHDEDDDEAIDNDAIPLDSSIRENAVLLHGSPISHLPTNHIFAYTTQFAAVKPEALEWIDDTTCILVFPSRSSARKAFTSLSKPTAEDTPDEEGFFLAHSVPSVLWPPKERINSSLGKGEGLKGTMRLRWATPADVKLRGANKQSEFYRKYGRTAGRENDETEVPSVKRRRRDITDAEKRAELDQDLDEFLTEGKEETQSPPSPPSKMRSDHMSSNAKSLLDRFGSNLESRLSDSSHHGKPRRRPRGEPGNEGRSRDGRGGRGRTARPKKTAEDLDAELDSFLKGGYNED